MIMINTTLPVLKLSRRVKQSTKCSRTPSAALGNGGLPGPWQNGGLFTNSRSMPLNGLAPGTSYTVQVRGIGGSSDWSNLAGHMSL